MNRGFPDISADGLFVVDPGPDPKDPDPDVGPDVEAADPF